MGLILLPRSNDALDVNPPVGTYHLVVHGSNWLWAVTAVYCVTLLGTIFTTYFAKQGEKIFHYLFTISLLTGSVAYFCMASDLGNVAVIAADNTPGTRQIFYARYINWFVGWTPMVIAVGLVSGVSWATIVYNVALVWAWVSIWLSGAMTPTNYKWGFFVFGVLAYFLLSVSLILTGSTAAKRLNVTKHYSALSFYLVFFYMIYPIAWGVDDGGNKIGVTSGFVFFGILDLFTVPFLAIAILALSRSWDYRNLNLYFTQYGRVPQGADIHERIQKEKDTEAGVRAPVATETA
jgi:bacteriorhodopsin